MEKKGLTERPLCNHILFVAHIRRYVKNICARVGIAPMSANSESCPMIDIVEFVSTHSEMHLVSQLHVRCLKIIEARFYSRDSAWFEGRTGL
jgi:ABC-type dipeptide/oligopeptide/nickel transport system ATPase subunit